MSGGLVCYYRVSTDRQGKSRLGLEAQVEAVKQHAARTGMPIVAEYKEVESASRKHRHRPVLQQALEDARRRKATLVVAKLDRLSRNVAFLANLMEAGVPFVCCDNPNATPLTIHILIAVAQEEARLISDRVKAAYAARRARGAIAPPTDKQRDALKLGRPALDQVIAEHRERVLPVAQALRVTRSLRTTARMLNDLGVRTVTGKAWSFNNLARLLNGD